MDIAYGLQVANLLYAGALFQGHHGALGASVFEIGTVDVPTAFYRALEGDFQLPVGIYLLADTELNGFCHLGHTSQGSHYNNK